MNEKKSDNILKRSVCRAARGPAWLLTLINLYSFLSEC
jgi:hypothetical protein